MGELAVYASPLPFSNKQVKRIAVIGCTVKEIVDLVCPPHLVGHVDAIVTINGQIVPLNRWGQVKPKEHTIVNVRIVPQGGGGGKKNPLATILTIAVMIAAPQIGGYLATTALNAGIGLSAAQGILLGKVLGGVVGIVGSMIVNALAPPPKPSNAGTGVSNPEESATQFIEGAQNTINPFGVVPICLGTNRMFPPQAARGFTESEDDDQYVRQLFTWGYGENLLISDLKIGQTLVTQFDNIDMEHRLAGNLHETTNLFSDDVSQENFDVLLTEEDGFTTRTTAIGVDEAIVDVTFPQGLTRYSELGNRNEWEVQLELQFADSNTSPQVWSPGIGFQEISGTTITIPGCHMVESRITIGLNEYYVGYRRDIIVIDRYSGKIEYIQGPGVTNNPDTASAPSVPNRGIRLSTILVLSKKIANTPGDGVTTIESYTDDRDPELVGTVFEEAGDFLVSIAGLDATVADGSIKTDWIITGIQSEALRRSRRVVFPTRSTYDIRIRRITDDSVSDADNQIFDEVFLTAIKSITHRAPVVLEGINGTAVRIKGTDQLNGAIDQLNAIVSNVILDFDPVGGWTPRATSNPASIYRYVLQGLANAKPLADSRLDLDAIQEWHQHCAAQGYSYNRIIDYETSVDEILRDVAAAGAASPAIVDGKRTIVVDRVKEDIVQIFTPRNTWNYSGEIVYPDMPHAFRVQFRNADKGYMQDERIVYDDGYNEENATKFEVLELQSCTNSDLAFMTGRRHIAAARLRPEAHTFMVDVENLVALRGDRILLEHDVPLVGIGDGRIKTVTTTGGSPNQVTGFTVDDTISIPSASTFFVRIRLSDGTLLYKQLTTTPGSTSSFGFTTPFDADDAPSPGDLCYFVEAGGELDLVITKIEPSDDLTAKITALDYAPDIFVAESTAIPSFESHITTPIELIRPSAPILLEAQSDESVMLLNSDGSFLTRAIFKLDNENIGDISVSVKIRRTGATAFMNANILEATTERVILTGLEDGKRYDIHIRYKRLNSSMISLPLQINNYLFAGASGVPSDVEGFRYNISGSNIIFTWDKNTEIDISHYAMRVSGLLSGAGWNESQAFEDTIYETRLTVPFQTGTYLIKAYDLTGNESANAVARVIGDAGQVANVVENIVEDPTWAGEMVNVEEDSGSLVLIDLSQDGYYYFDNEVDLTGFYSSLISATLVAGGRNNDPGGNDIFDIEDIFEMDDVFGEVDTGWFIQLQYRTTDTDPTVSPPGWGEWQEFRPGFVSFWGIQFRILFRSLSPNITPLLSNAAVSVDMPDRIERDEGLTVTGAGATITYSPEFKNNPSVAIALQNGDAADQIEFTSKTSTGFTFKVFNTGSSTYVSRIYDYIASGYGRKQ